MCKMHCADWSEQYYPYFYIWTSWTYRNPESIKLKKFVFDLMVHDLFTVLHLIYNVGEIKLQVVCEVPWSIFSEFEKINPIEF